jgi:hypothetical protein
VVYDGTGQPAPDGTVVQFFTDLGRVDEQGRTNDGVARVNLVADGRSGKATVTGLIGGGTLPAPSGSATATPTPTPATSAVATTSSVGSTARTASTATASDSTVVTIGSANPATVVLAADPRNITASAPRYSTLTATVFDGSGNPIPRIPVVFRIVASSDLDFTESLESGGRPIYTDSNGQARDRLWTAVARDAPPQPVSVQAVVVTATELSSSPVVIGINY